MTTYLEVAQALVRAGYVSDADVDAAASVLEAALVIESAQDAVAEALADEVYQEGLIADAGAMADLDVPVIKGTSGLLFFEADEVQQYHHYPCIRCGRCVDVCPMGLMACIISNYTENEMFDEVEDLNVVDCIECGSCAFVCPSSRILVHHLKRGKAEVLARRRKRAVS